MMKPRKLVLAAKIEEPYTGATVATCSALCVLFQENFLFQQPPDEEF